MVTKLGPFTKSGPFSTFQLFKLSKICYHFFGHVLKMEIIFFCYPIAVPEFIGQSSFPKKLQFCIFSIKKMQNWREEMGHFSFLNCSNFVTIFCQVLKMEIFFFDIPSNPPPIAVRNSLTNQFFQKKWCLCIFSTTTKKWQVYKGISILLIPDHLCIHLSWKQPYFHEHFCYYNIRV